MNTKDFFDNLKGEVRSRREKCLGEIGEDLSAKIVSDIIKKRKNNQDLISTSVNLGSVNSVVRCPNTDLNSVEQTLKNRTGTYISLNKIEQKECQESNHTGFLGYDPRPKCYTYHDVIATVRW